MTDSQTHFYNTIAKYYDYIFPLKPAMEEFTKKLLTANSVLLDAGCATGNLAIASVPFCQKVNGFDLDLKMIDIAQKKAKKIDNVHFIRANMLEMENHYSAGEQGIITCYGNTLVHLLSKDKILAFLKQSYKLLNATGWIALQVVNYDYIHSKNISTLPLIDNEHIIFIREYVIKEDRRIFDFHTTLKIKKTGETIENVAPLYALMPGELEDLLQIAGFEQISMYSSFNEDEYTNDKMPLVVKAKKV